MTTSMAATHAASKRLKDAIFGASAACAEAAKKHGADKVTNATMGVMMDDEGKLASIPTMERVFRSLSVEDYVRYAPILMKHKGAPIHSIEIQIYKAAIQAMNDGFDAIIFGESADVNYGGQDGLLSRDWRVPEYIERYSYLMPYKALKDSTIISAPFLKYSDNGLIDAHEFNRHAYYVESMGSYQNATETAGITLSAPFSKTYLNTPLDYNKIRNGESKYLVREVFKRLYPTFEIPKKIPMPRPMDEWLMDWQGPIREEFWPQCIRGLSGDQKWLLWSLEHFLDMINGN